MTAFKWISYVRDRLSQRDLSEISRCKCATAQQLRPFHSFQQIEQHEQDVWNFKVFSPSFSSTSNPL
jgi:hypothetical protein